MHTPSLRSGRRATAIVVAAMAAATFASSALAAQPTREVIDIGTPEIEALISTNLSDDCGFGIAVDADATITVMVFKRKDGTFHREIDYAHLDWTLTNLETGATSRILSVGPDIFWVSRDGVPMHASMGILLSEIGQFIGRVLTDDGAGELLRLSGHFVGDAEQVFCDPLRVP